MGEQEYFQRKGFIGVERARCGDCAKAKKRKTQLEAGECSPSGSVRPSARPTCGGRLICFDWQKGACARGDGCKFAHGEADGVLDEGARSCGPAATTAQKEAVLRRMQREGLQPVAGSCEVQLSPEDLEELSVLI